ncbi:hypothetical protein SDJN02_08965, partial [Cucurbita argyrosperma subsp. argyrosperma]
MLMFLSLIIEYHFQNNGVRSQVTGEITVLALVLVPVLAKRLESLNHNCHVWPEVSLVLNTQGCNCCQLRGIHMEIIVGISILSNPNRNIYDNDEH